MALHGGVGGDHQHVAGARGCAGSDGARLDDAQHRDRDRVLNGIEGQGAGGVAGDDEELGALLADQELRAFDGVAGDGAARFGAVGQARRVADKGKARARQPANERAQHGEPAEAGIEDADGGRSGLEWSLGNSRMRALDGRDSTPRGCGDARRQAR